MTLVVGRTTGGLVSIVSDTSLVQGGRTLPLTEGVIKSCALPSGVCISFAGSPELAKKDVWTFNRLHPTDEDFNGIINFFEEASSRNGNEYLVAFARTGELVKVQQGRRYYGNARTQWIGDKEAFEAFREFEGRSRRSPEHQAAVSVVFVWNELDGSPTNDLYSTMRQVIRSRVTSTVGGLVTAVSNREGLFRPPAISELLYDWPSELGERPLEYSDQVRLTSSGQNLDHSVHLFTAGYYGLLIVGFYFLGGKFAYLFHPSNNAFADKCTVLRDVEPEDLATRLNELMGEDWDWQIVIGRPVPKLNVQSPPNSKGVEFAWQNIVHKLAQPGSNVGKPPKFRTFAGPDP